MTVELSENFYINNKKKNNVKIQVKLNAAGIYLRRETEQRGDVNEQLIRIEDIFGSRCGLRLKKRARGGLNSCRRLPEEDEPPGGEGEASTAAKDTSAYLYIYAYVKKYKPTRRIRTVRILRFRTSNKYEENLKLAERWHQALIMLNSRPSDSSQDQLAELQLNEDSREILILLNPKSGSGKGREMFQKQVAPVLQEADVQYDLHVTKYANFAREFVRLKKDLLQRYKGIIIAAGDGLFYEVLNGIMERDDWQLVSSQLPLGIIPCGSGNGLARSIAHVYDEPYEPKPILNATLTCVSGQSTLMDVVRVEVAQNGKEAQMYSFLSVGWGLIADIDIESERLRSIGSQRFTLWSIHRVIKLRTYKGKVFYLPCTEKRVEQDVRQKISTTQINNEEISKPRFSLTSPSEFHDVTEDISEQEEGGDEFLDVISLDRNNIRPMSNIDSWHSATSRRTAYYSIAGQSLRSHRSIASKIEAAAAAYTTQTPVPTIPALNMPLPMDKWHCIEGEFVLVQAAYTTHLASDCHFVPDSRLNDGIIYLVIIRAGVVRSQLVQFLLNMSSGTHLPEQPNEHIQVLTVSAFRIEPESIDGDGIITVDGERVDYGAIQGEIFPSMIRVMVPKQMPSS